MMSKQSGSTSAKKEAVLGRPKKNRSTRKMVLIGLSLVLAAGAGVGFGLMNVDRARSLAPDQEAGQQPAAARTQEGAREGAQTSTVAFPVADFADGQAKYYQVDTGQEIKVKFFILKSSDGVIRAAFDACDVCWPAGRGYAQEGDEMVCRNCGRRFASVKINEIKGGCNPAPLERRVEGDKLLIEKEAILAGRGYFNFAQKQFGS
jgi:hypothetical protein